MREQKNRQPIFFHQGLHAGTIEVFAQAWRITPVAEPPTGEQDDKRRADLVPLHGVGVSLHAEDFHIDQSTPQDIVTAGLLLPALDAADALFSTLKEAGNQASRKKSADATNRFSILTASIGEQLSTVSSPPVEPVIPVEKHVLVEQITGARFSITISVGTKAALGLVWSYSAGAKGLFLPNCSTTTVLEHPALATRYKHLGLRQKTGYVGFEPG
jgi:hypothetical protein